ncbi:Mannan endo-1,4-beta-mannosidase [Colletotrichum siamense]|uniref:Mannan endo-1,4-beta-mannosidase n=1 Tax=Colletotrichum fructicola (strain Nara gc5) TaxID=1213859 RepID=L2GIX4_COLFN|nr:Mannan endo-1,4-beta-mannosidase [Colletotrichum fructicola]XP_036494512.1 Mannan endo-1,4-beta-mannosidase [Colletotrichum siamense]KAF4486379.1 Mannan endo-1,4-beta-mannosidase [Colletotrichum fructicola Nara gc5]KAH0433862.1 mannan endo-1, 4-beta-mannosidase [Colletotrichum camelliae]KAI8243574.1 Mannan endo-1,4-beta-mannosidase [Colletotrichum sp. SAR 10_96]KAI8296095.1 Mannan endo-1,4-beta-mannosidase [Colletotrichum sp. SAR 10_98]KAJ5020070.1 Mannan endo-1,4-beta-mannosidase [Colleto
MARSTALSLRAVLAFAAGVYSQSCIGTDGAKVYEAEDGVLSGTTVDTAQAGFTGTGYVTSFEDDTDKLTINVDCTGDGQKLFDLSIRYAGIYGEKRTNVVLNGGAASEVLLAAGETWANVSAGQVLLNQGNNTIDIVKNWGYYLIDSITLTPSAARGPHNINEALVNAKANTDANALYKYLRSIYGKNILSGQQELSYSNWVNEQIGKTPALVSVDLMDYSPSRVERGTVGTAVEEAITHAERGGIVSVLWHWNAPTGLYDTEENKWWSGFYTRATDFNVETALADTTNANYTLIIRDIDAIAVQLKKLQDAGVPVLWRPLHEAEGAWFWWGAKGPEACKKLYALLYDRLTNHHELNNLIWVWNSVAEAWYPGDETVDILSADVYAQGHGPMTTQYNDLIALGGDKKLIAATEVGSAPFPDLLQAYEAHWLYFCVWSDTFINNAEWNSVADLKTIYESEYVLTLDEIQGWRG